MTEHPASDARPESGAPIAWGDTPFLGQMSMAALAFKKELGIGPTGDIDIFFLAYLRLMSRFNVFSFGPITIYVPTIEDIVRRNVTNDARTDSLVHFSNLLVAEKERLGSPINELHALLAFMKVNEGLPGRVFGELGVAPEQVEEYARAARASGLDLPPPRLYSPEEAAEYLGIHVQTVRAWIRSGRLKASRLAGQRALRIKSSDLMTVLEPVDAGDQQL